MVWAKFLNKRGTNGFLDLIRSSISVSVSRYNSPSPSLYQGHLIWVTVEPSVNYSCPVPLPHSFLYDLASRLIFPFLSRTTASHRRQQHLTISCPSRGPAHPPPFCLHLCGGRRLPNTWVPSCWEPKLRLRETPSLQHTHIIPSPNQKMLAPNF